MAEPRRRIKVGLKVKGKKRPREWHHGTGQDRRWLNANERLDRGKEGAA
jgi:hypothetical protein